MFLQLFGSLRQAKQRREAKRKSKQSEEKQRRQQLQSSFALLEHFPKSIFYMLYAISKLWKSKIQRFKPCTIWSWNEEVMAFGSQLLQACAKISHDTLCCASVVRNSHNTFKIRTAHAWCEFSSVFADSTLDLFLCIFFDVISFLILVTNQSQAFAFVKTI